MKTARKTYLLTGLICAGLIWAGMAAFGQPDPQTPFPQNVPTVEPDPGVDGPGDPAADVEDLPRAIAPDHSEPRPVAQTQAGEPASAPVTTLEAMRKMEISSLEERVQRLNDLLQKREGAQAKIVESRLSQLLNAAEGLGWDNAAASGATSRPAGTFFRPTAVPGGPGGIIRGSTQATPPSAR